MDEFCTCFFFCGKHGKKLGKKIEKINEKRKLPPSVGASLKRMNRTEQNRTEILLKTCT